MPFLIWNALAIQNDPLDDLRMIAPSLQWIHSFIFYLFIFLSYTFTLLFMMNLIFKLDFGYDLGH